MPRDGDAAEEEADHLENPLAEAYTNPEGNPSAAVNALRRKDLGRNHLGGGSEPPIVALRRRQ